MKKKIMILAGGNDQAVLMEELRHFFHGNVELILLDMSSNVRAIPYADRFLPISTMDKEAVLQAAREEQIDYILTACGDQPLSTMAYVSEALHLPTYLSQQDVRDLTNKCYMKEKMVRSGIPTAKHICVDRKWNRELLDFKFPLVVKPVDSNGSKGVKKVLVKEDLEPLLAEAFRHSLSGKAIVEEFKEGEELSVDVYVAGNEAKILSITASKKIKENKTSFTIIQSYYPAPVYYDEAIILHIIQQIVDAWHLHDTPLLVQMIVNGDDYNVLEFSARMGGGSKYYLIKALSGVDIMKVYVQMVMGQRPQVKPEKRYNNAIMSYVYCKQGEFVSLNGFEELKSQGCILDYFVYKMPHSQIEKSDISSDRVCGFLVVGNTENEVKSKLDYANGHLAVLDGNNVDIMRHDLL